MIIKHEILSFDKTSGSILVRYFSDEFPSGLIYNIDVPVVDGSYVLGDELTSMIEAFKPVGQIERMVLLQTISIPDELSALIPKEPEPTPAPSEPAP
jgi:hypothetical protein